MEEHLLLHIVSQLNDYHLSDDDDDDDDDDEEEEGDEDDDSEEGSDEEESDEDDSEEDIYDEYGDDEKEEEKELAKKLMEKAGAKAKKTKKTPLGLAAWDDAETGTFATVLVASRSWGLTSVCGCSRGRCGSRR
jgi:hypothetical protein